MSKGNKQLKLKAAEAGRPRGLLREQERARVAYAKVGDVDDDQRKDYRIVVQDLGTNVRRLGLAAALSLLERQKSAAGKLLLEHLAEAEITGLGRNGPMVPALARGINDLPTYMLVTRELLRVAGWLNRAVQATFTEGDDAR